VDASRGPGEGDAEVAGWLSGARGPIIAVLNKVDLVRPKSRMLPMIERISVDWGIPEVVPVSARTGDGCDVLVERLFGSLPEGPPLYPEDTLTDQPERVLAAEWIREKLMAATRQELPHATAVVVDRWVDREDGLTEIEASILVDRESQKKIVIGRKGELLKRVGTDARGELERFLERHVMLRLWVRVRQDWRNDPRQLERIGL
jgi:GTP-binding protein Era